MNEVKEKKKIGLTTKIFIALIAGAIVGIALNMFAADVDFVQNVLVNGIFYVVGQGFIRLMQMLVVPLVFCSLICGATAIGDSKTLGKVGVKIIGFYIFTTMMAVAVALGIGLLIKPGMGLDMSQIQTAEVAASSDSVSFAETLLNIIPKNPIGALANGEMLQVIVFALIVGVILAKLQDKTQLVTNFFQQGNDIMMEMTMMVMGLAPIGVFCLIAKNLCGPRLLRDGADVQVHGRGAAGAGHPVLRRIPDSAGAAYKTQSAAFPQEIRSGYGLCVLDRNL